MEGEINLAVNCHIAEFNTIREEILVLERRLYNLSAAYLGFFGAIAGFAVKIVVEVGRRPNEVLLVSLLLLLIFINSLYNIIAASISWEILRLGLYIKDKLAPKVKKLLKQYAEGIWDWERLIRTYELGEKYPSLVQWLFAHGEVLFGTIIFLPSLVFSPVLLWVVFPKVLYLNDTLIMIALVFCSALFVVSWIFGILVWLAYKNTSGEVPELAKGGRL